MKIIRRLFWDIRNRDTRFLYKNYFVRNLPGLAGQHIRRKVVAPCFEAHGDDVVIHEGARFWGVDKLSVGNNVRIGVDNFIQASGGVVLEDDVILGPGVKIWTVSHRFNDVDRPISEQGREFEAVRIGESVWIGANVFVMPGVTIPEGCIVMAGSVVGKKKYPPFAMLAGFPARVVGKRIEESTATSESGPQ